MIELGQSLKSEREKRELSLSSIARKTNINIKYLEALEDGNPHIIPGDFYIRNYIKSYLEALDADVDEFFKSHHQQIDDFCSEYKEGVPKRCFSGLRYASFRNKRVSRSLVTLFFILVVVASSLFYFKNEILRGIELPSLFQTAHFNFPATGRIDPTLRFLPAKEFSTDRSPVNIRLEFKEECWVEVRRGNREKFDNTYGKGDTLKIKGYWLNLLIGKPAHANIFLENKKVSYLQTTLRPSRLVVTPQNIEDILNR